jgi:hypothetical protein
MNYEIQKLWRLAYLTPIELDYPATDDEFDEPQVSFIVHAENDQSVWNEFETLEEAKQFIKELESEMK